MGWDDYTHERLEPRRETVVVVQLIKRFRAVL